MKKIFAASFILFSTLATHALAQENKNTGMPVVVELFTSQNCPACPPADKIFQTLVAEQDIIALSCHVSYWDNPKRKDPLAQDFCDVRQHGYIAQNKETRVYTPQMVINGTKRFIGSHANEVDAALTRARKFSLATISIKTNKNDTVSFSLPSLPKAGNYRLWAFGYKKSTAQEGREAHYANAALTYNNLGKWSGEETEHNFPLPSGNIDGLVILAQDSGYGKIVAAGKIEF